MANYISSNVVDILVVCCSFWRMSQELRVASVCLRYNWLPASHSVWRVESL